MQELVVKILTGLWGWMKGLTMKILSVAWVLLVSLLECGGPSYVDQYGVNFNSERCIRGIPEIPTGWILTDFGRTIDYVNPSMSMNNSQLSLYASKRIFIDEKGQLQKEENVFYEGKTFQTIDGPIAYDVVLYYDFAQEKSDNPWTISANLSEEHFMDRITLEEADRILTEWGLSRTAHNTSCIPSNVAAFFEPISPSNQP